MARLLAYSEKHFVLQASSLWVEAEDVMQWHPLLIALLSHVCALSIDVKRNLGLHNQRQS